MHKDKKVSLQWRMHKDKKVFEWTIAWQASSIFKLLINFLETILSSSPHGYFCDKCDQVKSYFMHKEELQKIKLNRGLLAMYQV